MMWKQIPSYPDYEVSEFGDVKRITAAKGARAGHLMRPFMHEAGYRAYNLRYNEHTYHPKAHQLVAEAFLGSKPFYDAEVCHNDGSRLNDHYSNLRWDSRSNNHLDKRAHGTSIGGEKHHGAKLSEEDIAKIKLMYECGELQKDIAADFGVSQSQISRITNGARWNTLLQEPKKLLTFEELGW